MGRRFNLHDEVRDAGASLVLVSHPRKGRKGAMGLDELAGGTAYPRFSHTVLWLEDFKTPKEITVHASTGGIMPVTVNRAIHLCKVRSAAGHGLGLAYQFNGGSLTIEEKGVIEQD